MLTDIPCACVKCGLMYTARERMEDSDMMKNATSEEIGQLLKEEKEGNRFDGLDCEGTGCMSRTYRLLLGPLFVPRD